MCSPTFSTSSFAFALPATNTAPTCLHVADLNNDELPDIVICTGVVGTSPFVATQSSNRYIVGSLPAVDANFASFVVRSANINTADALIDIVYGGNEGVYIAI